MLFPDGFMQLIPLLHRCIKVIRYRETDRHGKIRFFFSRTGGTTFLLLFLCGVYQKSNNRYLSTSMLMLTLFNFFGAPDPADHNLCLLTGHQFLEAHGLCIYSPCIYPFWNVQHGVDLSSPLPHSFYCSRPNHPSSHRIGILCCSRDMNQFSMNNLFQVQHGVDLCSPFSTPHCPV